eukprot:2764269-Rhodomonas_salina.2
MLTRHGIVFMVQHTPNKSLVCIAMCTKTQPMLLACDHPLAVLLVCTNTGMVSLLFTQTTSFEVCRKQAKAPAPRLHPSEPH